MFILGVIVGLIATALVGVIMSRRQNEQMAATRRTSSSQVRRIAALENEVAEAKSAGAAAVRDEKLRNAREFSQYKILLRRADSALAQAKAQRNDDVLSEAA
jgi:hypothetical protein